MTDFKDRERGEERKFAMDDHAAGAVPNAGHRALARLINEGRSPGIVTQNIDGLHQEAGVPADRVVEAQPALLHEDQRRNRRERLRDRGDPEQAVLLDRRRLAPGEHPGRAGDDLAAAAGQPGDPAGLAGLDVVGHALGERVGEIFAVECAPAGQHFVHDGGEGPDVATLVRLSPFGLLRAHVGRRAEEHAGAGDQRRHGDRRRG